MYASSEILHQIDNDYRNEGNRLKSFGPWFVRGVNAKTLARAGFCYLGVQDHVKCNFCGVQIGGWSRGDNPFIEHMKHSPNCPFINEDPVYNVPIPNTENLLLQELALLRNSFGNNVLNIKLEKLSAERIAATARHPRYADGNERLKSFEGWPPSLKQTPQQLSDAGFFYLGVGDEVKCFYCGGGLRNFASSDHALYEHKKHYFDRCKFVQFTCENEQIHHLCEFMKNRAKAWKDLINTLNDLGGAHKDVKGWKEVWRNYKYNQKRKTKHAGERDTTNVPSTSVACDNDTSNKYYESFVESVAQKDEYYLTSFDENTMVGVGDMMFTYNVNNELDPQMNVEFVDYMQVDETSHPTDLLNTQLMQIQFKIDQLNLEIEKHKLELDTRIKQLDLVQKQKKFEGQWQEIESSKLHRIGN